MAKARQREGIAKAKAEGKYKGRKPTARAKSEDVLRLHSEGKTPTEIAKATGMSRGSVYRIVDNAPSGSASGRSDAAAPENVRAS